MDKIFAEMFSRSPDKTVNGDYFFRSAGSEHDFSSDGDFFKMSPQLEKESREIFLKSLNERTLYDEYAEENVWMGRWTKCLHGNNKNATVEEIFQKIANEKIPFMDIASGDGMGLASYIMKQNPAVPCLVTDIQPKLIGRLRLCINEYLPKHNISLASFDELDMPIKDNSLECITTICGFGASITSRSFDSNMSFDEFKNDCYNKLLKEVYRVLKPGGYFIAVEGEIVCDFDRQKIDDYFKTHDKLFDLYSRDYVVSLLCDFATSAKKCKLGKETFDKAGFITETEEHFGKKFDFDEVAQFLDFNGEKVHIEHPTEEDDIVHLEDRCVLYVLRKAGD